MTIGSFSSSLWARLAVFSLVLALGGAAAQAAVVADSVADFPTGPTGTKQGTNDWYYGYHNFGPNGIYDATPGGTDELILYQENDGAGSSATDYWTDTSWDWFGGNPPWDVIGSTAVHPNSPHASGGDQPEANEEHWVIRRYVVQAGDVTASGNLEIDWTLKKTNLAGTGVTGIVFHNGVALDQARIAGNNGTGVTRTTVASGVEVGDFIEIALTPVGPSYVRDDGSDGSANTMVISTTDATHGFVVADSTQEFSGMQGFAGWQYGYYDRTADGDATYQTGDFTQFLGGEQVWDTALNPDTTAAWSDTQHWRTDGGTGRWDYNPPGGSTGNPPWTFMNATSMHPNDNNPGPEHWAIKRWIAEVSGDLLLDGYFHNTSAGGDGTTGRILLNGVEIYSTVTDGFRTDFNIIALAVNQGDILDFVVDNNAPDNDGNDSTSFEVVITLVPEPATAGLGLLGLSVLALRRRRAA